MATEQQLIEGIRRADAAGDAQAVRALGQQLMKMRQPTKPKPSPKKEERSFLRDLGSSAINTVAGIGQGLSAIPDAATNALGAVMAEGVRYGGKGVASVAEAFGADARPIRQKTQQIVRDLYNPVTIGGAIEKAAPTPQDTTGKGVRIASQVMGGAANIPGLTALPARMMAKAPVKPVIASMAPKTAAKEIVEEGQNAGIRVLTSDVKPPRTFIGKTAQATGERVIGMGTGGLRQAQQAERVSAVKSILKDFGADDVARVLSDDVAADLAKTRGAELSKLTTTKNMVIDKFDDVVQAPNALKAIDEQIAKLKGVNEKAYGPVIAKLDEFKQVLQSGKSLRQIEENRKLLGDLFKDQSLASIRGGGEKALSAIYAPLRSDMGNFIRQRGGTADFSRWKAANDKLAAMAGELDAGAFKRALNSADITPENVANVLFSKKPSEVARLYANLSPKGQYKAQGAILQRAMDKAGGLDNLSPDKFVNEIQRLGKNVGIVFKGDDATRLAGLTRVLDATQRASTASVSAPTGVQNFMTGLYGGAGIIGGLKGLMAVQGYGALARAYESAPVRNIILKIGKSKAGSVQERILINRAAEAIMATVKTQAPRLAAALNDDAPRAVVASEGQQEQ